MYRGNSKILPIAILVIVAVVAIIALVSIGRAVLRGDETAEVVDDSVTRALLNTEADRSVSMTVRGPIVASENFRSYEIEISPIGRRLTIYKGYKDEIVEVVRLTNSTEAYTEFVNALKRANFTDQTETELNKEDVEGVCAAGRLYTFQLLQAQSVRDDSWITSCRDVKGTFLGNAVFIRDLFQKQIPDSKKLLSDIDI